MGSRATRNEKKGNTSNINSFEYFLPQNYSVTYDASSESVMIRVSMIIMNTCALIRDTVDLTPKLFFNSPICSPVLMGRPLLPRAIWQGCRGVS